MHQYEKINGMNYYISDQGCQGLELDASGWNLCATW